MRCAGHALCVAAAEYQMMLSVLPGGSILTSLAPQTPRVVCVTAKPAQGSQCSANSVLLAQALHDGCLPRLKKFMGRPQEYSPKARLLNFLGYKLPFDRHDWVVDRCGREVRFSEGLNQGTLEACHLSDAQHTIQYMCPQDPHYYMSSASLSTRCFSRERHLDSASSSCDFTLCPRTDIVAIIMH